MMATCSAAKPTKEGQKPRREKSRPGFCATHEMIFFSAVRIYLRHRVFLKRQETEEFCVKMVFSCRYRQENGYLCKWIIIFMPIRYGTGINKNICARPLQGFTGLLQDKVLKHNAIYIPTYIVTNLKRQAASIEPRPFLRTFVTNPKQRKFMSDYHIYLF